MLLAIDVGNTKTTLGIFADEGFVKAGDEPVAFWNAETDKAATVPALQALYAEQAHTFPLDAVVLSTVVASLQPVWQAAVRESLGIEALICNPATAEAAGLFGSVCEDNSEVGPDLVANAIAATYLCSLPVGIVDFGTATTLQYLDEEGRMLGVIIAPGAETSMNALFANASAIDRIPVSAPPCVIGRNTVHAVQSGIVLGEAARLDGLVELARRELGYNPYIVATGGLCELISRYAHTVERVDKAFTLKGLHIMGMKVLQRELETRTRSTGKGRQ